MANREPEHFLKGYKIDLESRQSLKSLRFLSIWEKFPVPFLYLATGKEPGGHGCLVVVLADGYDKKAMKQQPMLVLSELYTITFTLGIWVNTDS
jgi:hypothetical protein